MTPSVRHQGPVITVLSPLRACAGSKPRTLLSTPVPSGALGIRTCGCNPNKQPPPQHTSRFICDRLLRAPSLQPARHRDSGQPDFPRSIAVPQAQVKVFHYISPHSPTISSNATTHLDMSPETHLMHMELIVGPGRLSSPPAVPAPPKRPPSQTATSDIVPIRHLAKCEKKRCELAGTGDLW